MKLHRQLVQQLINSNITKRFVEKIILSFVLVIALNSTVFLRGVRPTSTFEGSQLIDLIPN